MDKKQLALWWSAVLVISVSANGILIKKALDLNIAEPLNFICHVIIFSTVILLIYALAQERRQFLNVTPQIILRIALVGFLCTTANYSLLSLGLKQTTAINYAFLSRSEVAFIMILGLVFLREKISLSKIILIISIVGGIYLITTSGKALDFKTGDLLILAACFFYSFGAIIAKDVLKTVPAATFSAYRNFFGGLFLLAYIFLFETLVTPTNFFWPGLIGVSVSLAILSVSKVLQYATALFMAVATAGALVITSLAAWLFLGETMNIAQIMGGGIVLASIYYASKLNL